MRKLHAFILALLLLPATPVLAQSGISLFHVDTTGITPSCQLPILYFETNRANLTPESWEDLRFIVASLEQHPEMTLRMRMDVTHRRRERMSTRLNKRRVKRLEGVLKKKFEVPSHRLVLIPYQPWAFRSAKDPAPSPLSRRSMICDCIWEDLKIPTVVMDQTDGKQSVRGEVGM